MGERLEIIVNTLKYRMGSVGLGGGLFNCEYSGVQ